MSRGDLTSTEYNGVITCLLHAAERINFLSPLPPASSYRPIPRTLGATNLISFLSEGKIGQETKRGRETWGEGQERTDWLASQYLKVP